MSQEHSIEEKRKRSAKFYPVRLEDCKDCAGWPSRTIFFAQRGVWKKIQEYDHVVYQDHQGVNHIGYVNFAGNDIVLKRSLLPDMYPIPPMILPRKEIKRCDLIISISLMRVGGVTVDQILKNLHREHCLNSIKKATSNG